jgi:tetratricopeptide (TPR) repeat protein
MTFLQCLMCFSCDPPRSAVIFIASSLLYYSLTRQFADPPRSQRESVLLRAATPAESSPVERARLLAGRALALEGLAEWEAALADYDRALLLARAAGRFPDPYVLNSRGNVLASLGRWQGVPCALSAGPPCLG